MRRVFRQRSEAYFPTHSDVIAVLATVKAEPWRAREVRGLDGHCARRGYDVRAGMEGWAPQGPNKRMRSEERMGGAAGNVSTGQGVFEPWRDARHRLRSATESREVCEGAY